MAWHRNGRPSRISTLWGGTVGLRRDRQDQRDRQDRPHPLAELTAGEAPAMMTGDTRAGLKTITDRLVRSVIVPPDAVVGLSRVRVIDDRQSCVHGPVPVRRVPRKPCPGQLPVLVWISLTVRGVGWEVMVWSSRVPPGESQSAPSHFQVIFQVMVAVIFQAPPGWPAEERL